MGLDVGDLHGFKAPLPTKGDYSLKVLSARDFEGKKEDENGEVVIGVSYKLRIMGPEYSQLTSGEPAVGFEFEDTLMLPRQSLIKKNPSAATRAKKAMAARLEACFGPDFPSNVEAADWKDREFGAELYVQFDSYAGEEIVKIGAVKAA